MSLVQRLEEIFEEAKAKAYEFEAPIATALHAIATHVETLAPAASAATDVTGKLEDLVKAEVAKLHQPVLDAIVNAVGEEIAKFEPALNDKITVALKSASDTINAGVDERVKTLFGELLAKASADDAAKAPPTPPEQLAAPAAGVADPQPQAAAAAAAPVAQPA